MRHFADFLAGHHEPRSPGPEPGSRSRRRAGPSTSGVGCRPPLPVRWALTVLLVAGCANGGTGGDRGSHSPAGEGTGGHHASLDEKGLRTALLDLTDFPTGWAADSKKAADERGRGVPEPRDETCRTLFTGARTSEVVAEAGFLRSRFGPFVLTRSAAYEQDATARSALDGFGQAGTGCAKFEAVADEKTVTYEAVPLSLPPLGDGSKAVRFQEESGGVVDIVFARVGENTVLVAQAGRKDLDMGGVEPLARRAVDKLRQVVAGRTPSPESSQPGATKL